MLGWTRLQGENWNWEYIVLHQPQLKFQRLNLSPPVAQHENAVILAASPLLLEGSD